MNKILLATGGVLQILLAAFHGSFPWLFNWQSDLSSVSNTNRAILYTANLWIILSLAAFAYISLIHWKDLQGTRLGQTLLFSMGLMWVVRAYADIAYFRIGVDGAWWRVALFAGLASCYWIPLLLGCKLVIRIYHPLQ